MNTSVHAEYRAFLLRITSADKQNFRLVKSSLDPLQYPHYFPIANGEVVTYDDTWMCKGRTSNFKDICQSPKEQQDLASNSSTVDTTGSNASSDQQITPNP